jgi:hypothetical protein
VFAQYRHLEFKHEVKIERKPITLKMIPPLHFCSTLWVYHYQWHQREEKKNDKADEHRAVQHTYFLTEYSLSLFSSSRQPCLSPSKTMYKTPHTDY